MALTFADMFTDGVHVPYEAQVRGFLSWSRNTPLPGYKDLGVEISKAMSRPDLDLARAADRLLQKLRSAGHIKYQGKRWHLTDKGEILRDNLHKDAN